MGKTKILRVRLTETQFERVKNNTEVFGKKSISEYCRELLLNEPISILKLNEISKIIKKIEEKIQKW